MLARFRDTSESADATLGKSRDEPCPGRRTPRDAAHVADQRFEFVSVLPERVRAALRHARRRGAGERSGGRRNLSLRCPRLHRREQLASGRVANGSGATFSRGRGAPIGAAIKASGAVRGRRQPNSHSNAFRIDPRSHRCRWSRAANGHSTGATGEEKAGDLDASPH